VGPRGESFRPAIRSPGKRHSKEQLLRGHQLAGTGTDGGSEAQDILMKLLNRTLLIFPAIFPAIFLPESFGAVSSSGTSPKRSSVSEPGGNRGSAKLHFVSLLDMM
jgi:hypothetical protein